MHDGRVQVGRPGKILPLVIITKASLSMTTVPSPWDTVMMAGPAKERLSCPLATKTESRMISDSS